MAAIKGLVVESKKVYQDIDLEELTGVDLTGNEPLKLAIAQSTVDYMRKRTESSKDALGVSFDSYSKSYKASEEFEAYNKSSKVNMKLTGDMLASIDFKLTGNTIRFSFDDSDEEIKAYGHMTGMKGHKHLDGKTPIRLFFGITEDDFKSDILTNFSDDLEDLTREVEQPLIPLDAFTRNTTTLNNSLDNFLGGLFDEEF
tara:strand:+ start:856 stop:1455 length:600 start_codon:yes stop_codon:yes gene_type:complete